MVPIIIFGALSGMLLSVLVGLLGSSRHIGFGWAFIISALFSPIIGLIAVLLSDTLPPGSEPKYGCIGNTFGCLGYLVLTLLAITIIVATLLIFISAA